MITKFTKAKLGLIKILVEESQKTGHTFGTLMLELMHAHNEATIPGIAEMPATIKQVNHAMAFMALRRNNNRVRLAAKELGISRNTLKAWNTDLKLGLKA